MKYKKTTGLLVVFSLIALSVLLSTCSNPFTSEEEKEYGTFTITVNSGNNSRAAVSYPPNAADLPNLKFIVNFTPLGNKGTAKTFTAEGTSAIKGKLDLGDYNVTMEVKELSGVDYARGVAIDNPITINSGHNSIMIDAYSMADAEPPVISAKPQGASYIVNATAAALKVSASVKSGTLTYQWYSNAADGVSGWSAISGATSADYTPPTTTAGTVYYYVVVKNTDGGLKPVAITCGPAAVAVSVDGATPTITTQPVNNSILAGETVTLIVAAAVSNGGTLSYQWYSNTSAGNSGGIPVTGSTTGTPNSYTTPSLAVGSYYYYCVVTNTYDGGTKATASSVAKVTVSALVNAETPTITGQPANPSILTNGSTNLTIAASVKDGGTLSYQWYRKTSAGSSGGTPVTDGSGATSASYTTPSLANGTYYYYCVVKNTNPTVNGTQIATAESDVATVTVSDVINAQTPTINTHLTNSSILPGQTAILTIAASVTDGGTLSYQWYDNGTTNSNTGGTAIGTNSPTYTTPTLAAGTYHYYCVVTNTNNGVSGAKSATVASNVATITVSTPVNAAMPIITTQPGSPTIYSGQTATLTVAASVSDGGTLSYQWYFNSSPANSGGTPLGISTAGYTTPPFNEPGTHYYYCEVTNTITDNHDGGNKTETAASNVATVTVNALVNAATPIISTQPAATTTILVNETVTLSVTASSPDSGILSYQWHSSTTASNSSGSVITGATSTSYTPATLTAGTYHYYCAVTNTNNGVNGTKTATATSNAATVTVVSNGTGTLTDPFIVHDVETLERVGKGTGAWANWSLSAYYKQIRDITLPDVASGESNWTQIGSLYPGFSGVYDGSGHTISKLTINDSNDGRGLFSWIESSGIVKNVGIVNCYINAKGLVGGVAGQNNGTVQNCYVTGDVSGTGESVGGVVGNNGGTVENCYATGNTDSSYRFVGGVVGNNSGSGMVQYCYATGNISSNGTAGGVVGSNNGMVQYCYATGNVSGGSGSVGGVVGSTANNGTVQNCYATGDVSSSGNNYIGGAVGTLSDGTVRNCYATGNVSGGTYNIGGVVGGKQINTSPLQNCVALNPNIINDNSVGRVVGSNSVTNCYGRSDMKKNNGTGSWTNYAGGKDGADITSSDWYGGNTFWRDMANFDPDVWNITNGSLPTLKNMPAGTQNPVVKPLP